jgi:hypothetical protein
MGGILIKHAMVEAALRGSTEDRKIFDATFGYIFLGVPNRGFDTSQLKTIVAGQPNEHLISDLAIIPPFCSSYIPDLKDLSEQHKSETSISLRN